MLPARWGMGVTAAALCLLVLMGCKREEGGSDTPVAKPSPSEELPAAGPPAETPPASAAASEAPPSEPAP